MASETTRSTRTRCNGCGFEAPGDSDEWDTVEHPPLGRMARCPDCGSTDVHAL